MSGFLGREGRLQGGYKEATGKGQAGRGGKHKKIYKYEVKYDKYMEGKNGTCRSSLAGRGSCESAASPRPTPGMCTGTNTNTNTNTNSNTNTNTHTK